MGMVRIVYRPDKSVLVIYPAPNSRREDESEEQWFKRVCDKATPPGLLYDDVDSSTLPATRADRDAWEGEKGKEITVNKVKADTIRESKANTIAIRLELEAMAKERIEARKIK